MTPRATAERLLRAAVSGTPGDMADCYADSVVIEMPFAAEALHPARHETTREALRARFAAGAAVRTYEKVSDARIMATDEPGVVVAEYTLHGRMTATGEAFAQTYVMVMTVEDGRITRTRDYTDPISGARLLGRLPDLVAALTPDEPERALRRMYDAFNARDVAAIDAVFAPGFVSHPMGTVGRAAIRDAWTAMVEKFPGLRADVQDVLVSGDRVASRAVLSGGGPDATLLEIFRVEDGLIAELWGLSSLKW